MRRRVIPPGILAHGAIEAVVGDESEAVGLDLLGHLRDRVACRQQFRTVRRIDTVEAGVGRREPGKLLVGAGELAEEAGSWLTIGTGAEVAGVRLSVDAAGGQETVCDP